MLLLVLIVYDPHHWTGFRGRAFDRVPADRMRPHHGESGCDGQRARVQLQWRSQSWRTFLNQPIEPARYVVGMTRDSRTPPTIYAVVRLKDGRYAVEITRPGEAPQSIKPFWTEGEANEWIAVERLRAAREDT